MASPGKVATRPYGGARRRHGYKDLVLAPAKSAREVPILGRGVYLPGVAEEIRYDAECEELFDV